ncbi:MAG: helix-turn-helix domain-containing protein, partial [Chloroflexota bacterium]
TSPSSRGRLAMPVPLSRWAAKRIPFEQPVTEIGNVATGPQLRARREALGVEPEDVAALAGCSAATIRHIEAGREARQSCRQRVSDALGALEAERAAQREQLRAQGGLR